MLARLITKPALRKLAGERYFERGERYFRSGAVARLRGDESGITARVIGTWPYLARLWLAGRKLDWGCTCPLGVEGEFCKRLVAAGLAWLSGDAGEPGAAAEQKRVEALLGPLDQQALLEMIADRALWDEPFHEELLLAARALENTRKRQAKKGKPAITRQETT